MNPKRITAALGLALLVSVGCTLLVARKINASKPAQGPVPEAHYVAPSRDLKAGEVLKQESLELVAWPTTNQIEGTYTSLADVAGRVVLFPLSKGQPILDRDLSAVGSGVGLAGKIPDGMRAIALRSDEVVGVAGFLEPGSHLDVLVTYHANNSPEPLTATVLQNAVVLAAGHQMEPDPEGKPSAVTVVTLLLTPEESERAVLASTQGSIHFLLRNGSDTGRTNDAPMVLSQLSGTAPAMGEATPKTLAMPANVPLHKTAVREEDKIEMVLGEWPQSEWQSSDKKQRDGRQSETNVSASVRPVVVEGGQ
jgi:pilus assembly protein CpaB